VDIRLYTDDCGAKTEQKIHPAIYQKPALAGRKIWRDFSAATRRLVFALAITK
jgi:hypothetical protein